MTAIIDLFAGAGGLSLGASWAGGDVRLMVDNDPIACSTLRLNYPSHAGTVLEADVSQLSGDALRALGSLSAHDRLLIVGGAPCQPFSKNSYWIDKGDEARYRRARARGEDADKPSSPPTARPDARRLLVHEFLRLVSEARADAFLFENVPSILHPRNRHIIDSLITQAESAGFCTTLVTANATAFGVPQRRRRVFVLAARKRKPDTPMPTHADSGTHGSRLRPVVTAGEAVEPYADPRFFEPEEIISGRWAEHLDTVPPGRNYKAHTAWGGHPNPTFETETRFWQFLLKLHPQLPSWTIPASPGPWTGPFHWETRRLRSPELAVLQGFPDGYSFVGSRRERVRQIGNAVPPPLAQKMVESVLQAMSELGGAPTGQVETAHSCSA